MSAHKRWYFAGTLAFVILLVATSVGWRFYSADSKVSYVPADLGEHKNAAWLGVEWVAEAHLQAEMAELAQNLRANDIRYVFVYASYMKKNGEFNDTYSNAKQFTTALRSLDPNLTVLAWIGLPLKGPPFIGGGSGYVDLGDPAVRRRIAAFSNDLVSSYGFQGIHVDAEPVLSGDNGFLSLLSDLRLELGPSVKWDIYRTLWLHEPP